MKTKEKVQAFYRLKLNQALERPLISSREVWVPSAGCCRVIGRKQSPQGGCRCFARKGSSFYNVILIEGFAFGGPGQGESDRAMTIGTGRVVSAPNLYFSCYITKNELDSIPSISNLSVSKFPSIF